MSSTHKARDNDLDLLNGSTPVMELYSEEITTAFSCFKRPR